jgi:hypothetical protein
MIKNDLMDTTPTVEDIGIVTVRMAVLTEATKEMVATAQKAGIQTVVAAVAQAATGRKRGPKTALSGHSFNEEGFFRRTTN